jgi:hypothetical protein
VLRLWLCCDCGSGCVVVVLSFVLSSFPGFVMSCLLSLVDLPDCICHGTSFIIVILVFVLPHSSQSIPHLRICVTVLSNIYRINNFIDDGPW